MQENRIENLLFAKIHYHVYKFIDANKAEQAIIVTLMLNLDKFRKRRLNNYWNITFDK